MQTARGLGWELIGISITDSRSTDSKRTVTRSIPRAGGRKPGTAEKSGCEKSRSQICDQPLRSPSCLPPGRTTNQFPGRFPARPLPRASDPVVHPAGSS